MGLLPEASAERASAEHKTLKILLLNETKGRFKVDDILFTTYTLAQYLQVSARTVQREVSRGRLSFVMVGGRRRYRRNDVEYYLRRQLQRSGFRVIDGGRAQAARFG